MVQFKESNESERITLPSTANDPDENNRAWVEVRNRITLKDTQSALNTAKDGGEYEHRLYLLGSFITDWNYTDEAGTKLPIVRDNIIKLDAGDANHLVAAIVEKVEAQQAVGGLDDDEKKTSSDTSTPSATVESQATPQNI